MDKYVLQLEFYKALVHGIKSQAVREAHYKADVIRAALGESVEEGLPIDLDGEVKEMRKRNLK